VIAPYAADPARSRGRQHVEDEGARGPRDAFQRDRDRVIHSISFRRLRHKTQVFMAPDGDHFRVRLTHSIEVAQIGRAIARALGLNEDLTEALCLAHDIGHPPFGHAGEDALKQAMRGAGGFDHNGHTLRVLTELENPYPRWNGLNLTWETLEGLAKHNGPVRHPGWALAEVARTWGQVEARYPDVAGERLARELVRSQIGVMVNDLIGETRARIAASGVGSSDTVRAAGRALVGFSDAMRTEERDLKRFMYANLYHHPVQLAAASAAHGVVSGLFAAYRDDPATLPEAWRTRLPADEPWRSRHIADFIAGMTDRYAVTQYRQVVGPVTMPDGF
jgi:dGTPase